jgi:hypothetical protein
MIARNGFSAKQRTETLILESPEQSDRAIAKELGISNWTVSQCRKRLEIAGKILPRPKTSQSLQACLHRVCASLIRPAPANDKLYDPPREDDPSFQALVEDIRQNGLLNPIGISKDGYIFDGHRRFAAVKILEWKKVQVRIRPISYEKDQDRFLELLVSCNKSRVKTTAEAVREGIVGMNDDAWQRVCDYREESSDVDGVQLIELYGEKRRSEIRDKISLKNAIIKIVEDVKKDWPTNDRRVFYLLLNIKGLLRNDRLKTPFENSEECYNDVTNMVTRLRLDGSIPFDSIDDETRPVIQWNTHKSVGTFIDRELENLFSGYWRDLLQSQSNWIESLVEKNTAATLLKSVASKYTVPMTSGRGYSSLPPRKAMIDRFKASGREKLVIICVTDMDPEGEDIPNAFGLSLRDDFGLDENRLVICKAALTYAQVQSLSQSLTIHEGQMAKEDSSRYQRFVSKYGKRCWELEAIPPDTLREIFEAAIRRFLNIDAFEQELDKEAKEQRELDNHRQEIKKRIINL